MLYQLANIQVCIYEQVSEMIWVEIFHLQDVMVSLVMPKGEPDPGHRMDSRPRPIDL